MPRPPKVDPTVAEMPAAVFSKLAAKISSYQGELFPLHVGDTWMEPFVGGRMQDLSVLSHPGMHRYASTQGLSPLIDAVLEKVRIRNHLPAEKSSILISAGATGALSSAIGALVKPGEEVLILAPFWPLIRGIVSSFRAQPVEVPFYGQVASLEEAIEAIESRIGPNTVALYVSSPSNPTGIVIPDEWLMGIAELARKHNLWIFSDEVYEEMVFEGTHSSIGRHCPERSLTSFSFSKTYGMAGNRTGYLVGPSDVVAQCRKISTHTFYSAPTSGQIAALQALRQGGEWVSAARMSYRESGYRAADVLGLPRPAGGTFLFFDVAAVLDERGVFGFLEDCLEDGLLLAPGSSFGRGFESYVRLCFTSAPPERVDAAVRLLAQRLA